jgi:hypothetical protein
MKLDVSPKIKKEIRALFVDYLWANPFNVKLPRIFSTLDKCVAILRAENPKFRGGDDGRRKSRRVARGLTVFPSRVTRRANV